jgi:rod shape-determining protein MreC
MRDYLDKQPMTLRGEKTALARMTHPLVVAITLSVVALVLIVLDQKGVLENPRETIERGMYPPQHTLTHMRKTLEDVWTNVSDVQQLREENAALKHEISQLRAEAIQNDSIKRENTQLHQQLAMSEHYPWVLQGAEVIVRPADAGRRILMIARGSNDTIEIGMAVIGETETQPAGLVGIVESVGMHTASILLINDYSSRISARILTGETTALGLITGAWQHGTDLHLEQLDRTIPLETGQDVVSAGLTGNLGLPLPLASVPPGIPIGRVSHIIKNDNESQVAEIEPFVNLQQVRHVWVILSHAD